jgi:hypothetical protein
VSRASPTASAAATSAIQPTIERATGDPAAESPDTPDAHAGSVIDLSGPSEVRDELAPVALSFEPHPREHSGDHQNDHQPGANQDGQSSAHTQRLRRFAHREYSENVGHRRKDRFGRAYAAVADLELPEAVFKTCPWQPRELIETGLRQWLRCCAPAVRDDQVIGMPSHAVDEAWHGLILCTARYAAFCEKAYGKFLHHHPEGGAPADVAGANDPVQEQLRRTVIAWSLVARAGEQCVLWDLDKRVGIDEPWGIDPARVAEIQAAVTYVSR